MITVVVSSYRYGHLAAHCIESILSQSKKPSHIIFVDDGVGDCEHLPKLYPDIEYVLREKNLGVVDNFDDALKRVTSEYVMFLGADNWLRSDAIECLSSAKTDIVTYDIMVTGELKSEMLNRHEDQLEKVDGDLHWNRKLLHHGSMLYRTKLGQAVGYRKRKEGSSYTEEDWNLWNKMVENGASVSYIPKPLLYYRRHRENFLKYDK